MPPTPFKGVKTICISSISRRGSRLYLRAQIHVGFVQRLRSGMDLAGSVTASFHGRVRIGVTLLHQVGHDLVVGSHRLAAAFVIEFAAIIVGRIVRSRNIQAAMGLS